MQITEENFLDELRKKNEDALAYVVKRCGGLMKAVIGRILAGCPEDAEECLDDAVMRIWEHSGCYDGRGSFDGWTAAIAKFAALDRLRVLRRLHPAENLDEQQIADPSGLTGDDLFDGFFAELIACLSEEDQALFIRLFWNGDSMDEASRQTGKDKSVLYNRISRAKRKIIRQHPGYFKKEEKS